MNMCVCVCLKGGTIALLVNVLEHGITFIDERLHLDGLVPLGS